MLKKWLLKNVEMADKKSIAYRCRKKRFRIFERFFRETLLPDAIRSGKKLKILDVGGTPNFWKCMNFRYLNAVSITTLNVKKYETDPSQHNVHSVVGDATNLSRYEKQQFDLVFSNSVIEHVGDFEKQREMVREMMRVGRHGYLQTPNKYFVLEPHFLVPFFQFFPLRVKAFLVRRFKLGVMPKAKDDKDAIEIANSVRLMTKKELGLLFPGVEIRREKIGFITKSFYLYF